MTYLCTEFIQSHFCLKLVQFISLFIRFSIDKYSVPSHRCYLIAFITGACFNIFPLRFQQLWFSFLPALVV